MISLLSMFGKIAGLVSAVLGFFRDRQIRKDGANEQALESTQDAEKNEQIARDAANLTDAERLRIRSKFTRPE